MALKLKLLISSAINATDVRNNSKERHISSFLREYSEEWSIHFENEKSINLTTGQPYSQFTKYMHSGMYIVKLIFIPDYMQSKQ